MKVINVPTLVLTVEEHEKIAEIVSMLYDTDAETDKCLNNIVKDMQGCSLLGILEEILDRAKVSL
jgi:hypothetical protein